MNKIARFLFSGSSTSPLWQDAGLLLWRLFLGLAMALAHGWGKLPPSERFAENLGAMGFPAPMVFAWLAAIGEFGGGLLLALGLATRLGALMVAIPMTVAAFIAHGGQGFTEQERALLFLFGSLPFLLGGAGRFSVDHFLLKR